MNKDEIDEKLTEVRLETLESTNKLSLLQYKDLLERVQNLELALLQLIKQQEKK